MRSASLNSMPCLVIASLAFCTRLSTSDLVGAISSCESVVSVAGSTSTICDAGWSAAGLGAGGSLEEVLRRSEAASATRLCTNLWSKPSAGSNVAGDVGESDLLLNTPDNRLQAFFNPLFSFASLGAVSISVQNWINEVSISPQRCTACTTGASALIA